MRARGFSASPLSVGRLARRTLPITASRSHHNTPRLPSARKSRAFTDSPEAGAGKALTRRAECWSWKLGRQPKAICRKAQWSGDCPLRHAPTFARRNFASESDAPKQKTPSGKVGPVASAPRLSQCPFGQKVKAPLGRSEALRTREDTARVLDLDDYGSEAVLVLELGNEDYVGPAVPALAQLPDRKSVV